MLYKVPPIEIPKEDPFQNDVLRRKDQVEGLVALLQSVEAPFVLAIDSPWGTGKTTFVRMVQAVLSAGGSNCIHFNAWRSDFASDPMVAFLGEIETYSKGFPQKKYAFQKHFKKAKQIATVLAKKAIPIAGKMATAGVLDLSEISEAALGDLASGVLTDAVDLYSAEKELEELFRELLSSAIGSLSEGEGGQKVFLFVDELDRCRPTYAISLLERIKHLFNVENVIFVLSLDKKQLHTSLGAIYGRDLDSSEYLRRFIDLEFLLPPPDADAFAKQLVKRFEFDRFFSERTHPDLSHEEDSFNQSLVAMTSLLELNLRAREQCFTRIRVAMQTTANDQHLFPLLLVPLTVLRIKDPDLYRRYAFGGGAANEVINSFRECPGGVEFLETRLGTVIEAYLIAAKLNHYEVSDDFVLHQNIAQESGSDAQRKERSEAIVSSINQMINRDRKPSVNFVVKKIELAAQFGR